MDNFSVTHIELVYSKSRGTWNVIVDDEWYFEGTYDQCCDCMDRIFDDYDDDNYEEEYPWDIAGMSAAEYFGISEDFE